MQPRPRVGVSACLLGQHVRFDGGHKYHEAIVRTLGPYCDFVDVCPEVEIGLGTPRPKVELREEPGGVRLKVEETGRDLTGEMRQFARQRIAELEGLGLSGFVLKSRSPSCGLKGTRLVHADGRVDDRGRGLFAAALTEALPDLPVAGEDELDEPAACGHFLGRVLGHARLAALFAADWGPGDLVRFHTREKLLLLAHDEAGYRELGPLVSKGGSLPRDEVEARYRARFLAALAREPSTGGHLNALEHAVGHFRERAPEAERRRLHDLLNSFRTGEVPLGLVLRSFYDLAQRHGAEYLAGQTYFTLDPTLLVAACT